MSTTPVPLLTERRESSRYDVLFEPVQIGPLTTKNRFLWSCGLRFSLGVAAWRDLEGERPPAKPPLMVREAAITPGVSSRP